MGDDMCECGAFSVAPGLFAADARRKQAFSPIFSAEPSIWELCYWGGKKSLRYNKVHDKSTGENKHVCELLMGENLVLYRN